MISEQRQPAESISLGKKIQRFILGVSLYVRLPHKVSSVGIVTAFVDEFSLFSHLVTNFVVVKSWVSVPALVL